MSFPAMAGLVSLMATVLGMPATAAVSSLLPAQATDPAPVIKTGWWWTVNTETPLDDTPAATNLPAPPWIPATGLPVAAIAGDPQVVSAIEFGAGVADSEIVEYVFSIGESTAPGTQISPAAATVLACPIDEFWADGRAARWSARPAYDCGDPAVPGVRDDAGVWTFDLTELAARWAVPGYMGSESVALVPDQAAGGSFQVVFETTTIALRTATVPLPVVVAPTPSEEPEPIPDMSTVAPISDAGLGVPVAGPVVVGAPTVTEPRAVVAPTITAVPAPMAWNEGLNWRSGLLVPLVLGLAYLLMLALGPDAQPAPATTRQGRIGRALDEKR
jgi:hypothetical protein